MKIHSVRHIEGPNVYLYKPILVARIHLEDWTEKESTDFPEFQDALVKLLPGLADHHCAKGEPGGFLERLQGGTYFGHIAEHVAIELATLAGLDVHYGKTVYADGPGIYDIVMECESFACQRELLHHAVELVSLVSLGQPPHLTVDDIVLRAKKRLQKERLGPSTQAIVDACKRRNIPVRRIGNGSLLELGYGVHQKRVSATITDQTSCVAVDIASDKELTKTMLREAGIPVPDGGVASSPEEALQLLADIQPPVVIKPLDGRQGMGVTLNIRTNEEAVRAYSIASEFGTDVLVEEFVEGHNVRLLVVDGACVAASLREPAMVNGDGVHSIEELVEQLNQDPRRGFGHEKPLTQIHIDAIVKESLSRRGLDLQSIPAFGESVILRDSANLSTGGQARDITDEIHDEYKRLAERSARRIGLDVCGIDMVIEDIHEKATRQNCAIIELNAAPGIRMHQYPSHGKERDVADAIVESLFPRGHHGRIPIVSVTGTNGKTTTARLIAHGLQLDGKTVGLTTTGGVFINDTCIQAGDTTGPRSAQMVLSDNTVEAAVLETARGGIVRGGLAYDKADVGVLTNITLDHVGQDYLDSIDDILHVKSLVAECVHNNGAVVLNADDEMLMQIAPRLKASLVLTSSRRDNPHVVRHIAQGKTAYYIESGVLVEAAGQSARRMIARVDEIPITMGGTIGFHVENALLAAAAMRSIGMSRRFVACALRTFQPEANPGRCMMYRMPNGSHVILDYAHNPAGFRRIGEWLEKLPHRYLIGVVGVPGDRANHVVEQAAQSIVPLFDAVVIKEDEDKRGRANGEIATLLHDTMARLAPELPKRIVLSEVAAMETAIEMMQQGDIACVFYESMRTLEEKLIAQGAVQVNRIEMAQTETYAMK